MNSINFKNSKFLKTFGYLLIFFIIYSFLVIGDFLLSRYMHILSSEINPEALGIEKERYETQDVKMIKEAKNNGFSSVILTPEVFETPPITNLVDKYKILPLGPRPYTKYYLCNEGYGMATYLSDRFGFRNKDEVWDEKNIDAILIGDSFTHGACVEDKDSISGIMSFKNLNIINLGTWGNGPIHYANIASNFIEPIKPKNVILIIGPNDNLNEKNNIYNKYFPQKPVKYFDNYNKKIRPKKISANLNLLYSEALPYIEILTRETKQKRIFEGNILKRAYKYLFLPNTIKIIQSFIQMEFSIPYSSKLMIDTLISECNINFCKPIIVYIPTSEFWRPDSRSKKYLSNINKYIDSINENIVFIDLTGEISKLGRKGYSIQGPHLSPEGYRIASEIIYKNM